MEIEKLDTIILLINLCVALIGVFGLIAFAFIMAHVEKTYKITNAKLDKIIKAQKLAPKEFNYNELHP